VDCGNRLGLEYDHERPFADGGPTSLDNLGPRCERCHLRKTARDRQARGRWKAGVAGERGPPGTG
jgi:5-methylcytosine-specific restriction endonuclease McrA